MRISTICNNIKSRNGDRTSGGHFLKKNSNLFLITNIFVKQSAKFRQHLTKPPCFKFDVNTRSPPWKVVWEDSQFFSPWCCYDNSRENRQLTKYQQKRAPRLTSNVPSFWSLLTVKGQRSNSLVCSVTLSGIIAPPTNSSIISHL